MAVYKFLYDSYNVWKTQDFKFRVLGLLYVSIGDYNEEK